MYFYVVGWFGFWFCFFLFSLPPRFNSGSLFKPYLRWDSHKANTEPGFSIFLNPQCEEIRLCRICGVKSSLILLVEENLGAKPRSSLPFLAGYGGHVNLITCFRLCVFWLCLPEEAASPLLLPLFALELCR